MRLLAFPELEKDSILLAGNAIVTLIALANYVGFMYTQVFGRLNTVNAVMKLCGALTIFVYTYVNLYFR